MGTQLQAEGIHRRITAGECAGVKMSGSATPVQARGRALLLGAFGGGKGVDRENWKCWKMLKKT